MIEAIRERAPTDIIDYPFLIDCLKEYKKPRDKISALIKKGELIRIKKGVYVLGERYRRNLYSREALANLIYGPSYISLEYALSFYGLIPERVEELTSMTCNRSKTFNNFLGRFNYHHSCPRHYPIGVTYQLQENIGFLIATPEKALADCVARRLDLATKNEVKAYVLGLRIGISDLAQMNPKRMEIIAKDYQNSQIRFLYEIIIESSLT